MFQTGLSTLILPKFCCIYAQKVATTDKPIQALIIPIRYWDFSDLPIRLIGVIGISVVPWCGWSSAHIVLRATRAKSQISNDM